MTEYKIYPKQFLLEKIPVEKNRCFMLMPFSKEFDLVYGAIKQDLNDNGLICNRCDEIAGSKPILNKILTEIMKSQYIIADLTNYNPNVFYELGIAHSFKDASNILLLKQKESKVPFDLTHLTYIEYTPDNLRFLTATIRNFIAENQYVSDFYEALNLCGITHIISDNHDSFIDYLQEFFGPRISIITNILNEHGNTLSEKESEQFFKDYESLIRETLYSHDLTLAEGIVKVYFQLLAHFENHEIVEYHTKYFMNDLFTVFTSYDEEILSWKSELMILLAQRNKLLKISMPWIIGYFARSKSATIDLNRYKLESFLLTTEDNTINQIIVDSLFDENCYIREHMADIIGEKKIYEAKNNLVKQLEMEKNYFTASSIIEALGKIGDFESLKIILRWVNEREEQLVQEHQYFVLKHVFKAVVLLDSTPDNKYSKEFKSKYDKYMKDNIVN